MVTQYGKGCCCEIGPVPAVSPPFTIHSSSLLSLPAEMAVRFNRGKEGERFTLICGYEYLQLCILGAKVHIICKQVIGYAVLTGGKLGFSRSRYYH
jgi:hypothetical protein